MYSPSTGVHEIHGDILKKYNTLPVSRLGFPTSDEQDFTEGGKVSFFEKGAMYWWPDTGAIPIVGNVTVTYTGINAFKETDWDQSSDSDEPYVVMGVMSPTGAVTKRSSVYQDVDSGENRRERIELYRRAPNGLDLSVLMMENDFGNPDEFKGIVQTAVSKAADGLKTAIGAVPVVGPALTMAAGPLLDEYVPKITNAINSALDTDDDKLGQQTIRLSAKQMVTMAQAGQQTESGVEFKFKTNDMTGASSRYRAYFTVGVTG